MAGTLTVDTIQSDTSYTSTINVASKINFSAGMQVGGQDTTFGGMRNRLINGAMLIDQRRNGAVAYGETDFNNKPNTCDMWYAALGNGGGGTTLQQVSDAPSGFSKSLKWTGRTSSVTLGSSNWDALLTSVEGLNIADLGWGAQGASPITISFWVKGSVATTMSLAVYNGGTSDNAPSTASITRCYVANYTINTINTWEYKTITIPGPTSGTWRTDNGIGLTLYFNLNSGSNYTGTVTNTWETVAGTAHVQTSATATNYMVLGGNKTFQLTGVQLEKGSSATPFEWRQYQQEFALCQRYACSTFPYGTAWAQGAGPSGMIMAASITTGYGTVLPWQFPVNMRATPTITTYNPYSNNANARDYAVGADKNYSVMPWGTPSSRYHVGNADTSTSASNGQAVCIHYSAIAEL